MSLTKITLLTLNIQNYYNFDERKPKIITLIKKYNPDIVAFQEIRDDRSKNEAGMNQLQQLTSELNFPYSTFLVTMDINKVKNITGKPICHEGLALCSKFPFLTEEIILKKHPKDRHTRKILVGQITIDHRSHAIFVVHFSPDNLFAQLHAEETLNYAKQIQPIIIGDFNMLSKEAQQLAEKNNYTSSAQFQYNSYPTDNCSYDYIFIPKQFSFLKFECIKETVSDHNALFAEIKL